jgi:ADP-ribose pyrophosphatase YjhB (NUDIX family)
MIKTKKLPFKEFRKIYSKVPRLCVDLVIKNTLSEILLTKRDIDPYKGYWHFPGGTILFDESVENSINRVAYEETRLKVVQSKLMGYIDYPKLDPIGHTITMVFLVKPNKATPQGSEQGLEVKYFDSIPNKTIPAQELFLLNNNLLTK